ncbi:alpha,alpha-trehalose-phosphate synthase (UDP-forming) [Natrinema versiforme]|uniref:Alpha,alpha-trehalose-phosphate synthase (UDP-forming) n=1 Tax=Natrinema versiforme JCM 10478 TaxID=1227496 RepID=L9Y070_9EURY|nr:trehalose-6-phosphate synthase [Natrinema versiforme]ELY67107.1 Alpha,alpha-trehalose-phosphate synthase (UDP- forming) [Natrinema versiforme JCM 10478]
MRVTERLSSTTVRKRQRRADGRGRTDEASGSSGPSCPGSLIVVSNRQPYRHEYEDDASAADANSASDDGSPPTGTDGGARSTADARSITVDEPTGGLTAGLDPVVKKTDGTWIAWGDGEADFDVTDERNCVAVPPDEEAYTLRRLDLSEEAVDSYYYGFSNRVLWPLCHGFPDLIEDRSNDFEWYRTVNERFAEAVADHATDDSVIWLQDYHLALAPRMIRESVPAGATVAQFWHIPWPSPSTFRHCPAGGPVLEGLLGNDLLGFHVERYADQFLDCVDRFLAGAAVDYAHRTVRYEGTTTRVVATPMGVDAESYDRGARSTDPDRLSDLFDEYGIQQGTMLGLGLDRLDYSKGIPERLAALERFFERNPDWRGDFTFLQKATPSRTEIETYEQYGELVRSEVTRINRRFETDEWQPIVYTEDVLPEEDLYALYRRADTMIVSPLIDGMNLVAQEYLAASVDGDGTLLLSNRTGAHDRFGSHALTIDPTDVDGFASQLEHALSMPPYERRRRMNTLRQRVFNGDIEAWMDTQFDWIRRVHGDRRTGDASAENSAGSGSDTDSDSDSKEPTPPA